MKFPPENFEILRQFLIMLRHGEIELDVGKKSLKALIQMVNDPDSVAINNIVTLAEQTDISPASITRLAKLLGYQGFNQFQLVFKKRTKIPSDYYSQKVKLLIDNKADKPECVFENQLTTTIENMRFCINQNSDEVIDKSIHLLARSNRVFIFGHKQSSAMANVFRYGLCLIRHNVQVLGQYEHGLAIALGQLKKNDLVVIFSSAPYSNLTLDIAATVKKIDCKVLAITDSFLSPLNDHACASVIVPTGGQYYTNSLAANCIFIEGILSLTARELGQIAVNKLQTHEKLMTNLNENS
jgi:DNA-binding MurR/RpiR family transcriptional regulator